MYVYLKEYASGVVQMKEKCARDVQGDVKDNKKAYRCSHMRTRTRIRFSDLRKIITINTCYIILNNLMYTPMYI
jgi:hypothetical protein